MLLLLLLYSKELWFLKTLLRYFILYNNPILFLKRVDQAGVICKQEGIFRVNCMDCLDRTNVVQAAIARVVMEQQVIGGLLDCNYSFLIFFHM